MIEKAIIDSIAEDSVISCGTAANWDSLFQKKKWNISFLGGSVTCGYIAQHFEDNSYPKMVTEALGKDGYETEMTLCAEPGMFTLHCHLLLDTYVMPTEPDLVFLEFAINEMKLPPNVKSFESLIRRFLTMEKPPIICVVILRNASDYSCESYMQEIAAHYGLPCVNVRRGLNAAIEAGKLTFADYADHESHPYEDGHKIIAEAICAMLRQAKDKHDFVPSPLPEPWIDPPYAPLHFDLPAELPDCGAEVIALERPYFRSAVHLTSEHPRFEIRLTSNMALVLYEVHQLPNYGCVNVLIDGKPAHEPVLHSNSLYGWGNPFFSFLWIGEKVETHTITLELIEGEFFLLGVASHDSHEKE